MLLWSIQHKRAYEKTEQTGMLRADKNFIATDWFEDSYLWMAEQMKKRIGNHQKVLYSPCGLGTNGKVCGNDQICVCMDVIGAKKVRLLFY